MIKDETVKELEVGLRLAIACLDIGRDWGSPAYCDTAIPAGWENIRDELSHEPTWVSVDKLVTRLKVLVAAYPTMDSGVDNG
jgi:hypothetical protein